MPDRKHKYFASAAVTTDIGLPCTCIY